jgi:heavy metal translocating P-type ATPase
MERIALATTAITLLPSLPQLIKNVHPRGRKAFFLHVITLLFLLAPSWLSPPRQQHHSTNHNTNNNNYWKHRLPGIAFALCLPFYLLTKRKDDSMAMFVAMASAPTLSEFLRGEDADVPACLALMLGLLMNHPWAASVTLLMVTGGEALEELALSRAGYALQTLLETNPSLARMEDGQDLPAGQVQVGDIFIVRPNETVAVDAVIVMDNTGTSSGDSNTIVLVDEKIITGEPISTRKYVGDTIYAGSVNRSTFSIRARAIALYQDSVFHQMQSTLESALQRKSHVELQSKRIADNLTPITLLAASIGFLFAIKIRKQSIVNGWNTVLSVLMSATPCPADIGVPVAMLSGMSRANERFASAIKSGGALEGLCDCKCVVFDKTGTLTFGKPRVSRFVVLENVVPAENNGEKLLLNNNNNNMNRECLRLVACLESQSKHVLADSIVTYYVQQNKIETTSLGNQVSEFNEISGLGVSGIVTVNMDGQQQQQQQQSSSSLPQNNTSWFVKVGCADFFSNGKGHHHHTSSSLSTFVVPSNSGILRTFFTVESRSNSNSTTSEQKRLYSGYVEFDDPVRPESIELVRKLKSKGLFVVILSGDKSSHLHHVAKQLNVDAFHSCLPHEKANKIATLQQQFGTVVMVGDGANDSAALAQANVGISIDATSLSSEAADIVILNGDVSKVGELIGLGKRVVRIARGTVKIGTTLSMLQVLLAATGITTPFQNAVAQEIIDVGSLVNAMRAMWI